MTSMLKNNASERDTMQIDYSQTSQVSYGDGCGCGCNKGMGMNMNPCQCHLVHHHKLVAVHL